MKIEGQHTFAAPRDVVWRAVLDPTVLARILPGCEDFREVGENTYKGTLKIKVGPVQGKFKGDVKLSELEEPSSYRLSVKGKGAPGFVDGQGSIELEDAGDKTLLRYTVDAKVGGRIATVGQRLLDSSSKVITRQSLEGLDAYLAAETEAEAAEAEAEAAEAAISEAEQAASAPSSASSETAAPAGGDQGDTTEVAEAPATDTNDQDEAARRRAEIARAEAAAARQRAAAARHAVDHMAPPSQAAFAARFMKEMFEEVVPEESRGKVGLSLGIVVFLLIAFLFKGC